jgi:hypothetical protein
LAAALRVVPPLPMLSHMLSSKASPSRTGLTRDSSGAAT